MNDAIAECKVYGKIGALDEQTLRDIAYDNDVSLRELRQAIGWDE